MSTVSAPKKSAAASSASLPEQLAAAHFAQDGDTADLVESARAKGWTKTTIAAGLAAAGKK